MDLPPGSASSSVPTTGLTGESILAGHGLLSTVPANQDRARRDGQRQQVGAIDLFRSEGREGHGRETGYPQDRWPAGHRDVLHVGLEAGFCTRSTRSPRPPADRGRGCGSLSASLSSRPLRMQLWARQWRCTAERPASWARTGAGASVASVASATTVPTRLRLTPREPSDAPAAAEPAALDVKVKSRTDTVSRGDKATVSVRTLPKAKCSIEVDYASGPSKAAGLGDKTANSTGDVTWSWTVSSRTTRGTWPVTVTCDLGDRTGEANTSVMVR